jgi:transcriptional regulator with XRE-family HTH domain
MKIGENIKKLRESRGFTQEAIYKISGLTTSYQSQIETGAANPGRPTCLPVSPPLRQSL